MKRISNKIILCVALLAATSIINNPLSAQECCPKATTDGCAEEQLELLESEKECAELILGADLVSSYVWRGVYQGAGPSIQPTIGVGYKGLSLSAWGSTDFQGGYKEIDLTLAYEFKGFEISITDYWWEGEGSPYFSDYMSSHSFEAGISYTISDDFPLTIGWYTFFAGDMDRDEESGKQNFSTAITLGYDFYLKNDYTLTAAVVVSPWASPIWLTPADKRTGNCQVAAIQLTASKDVKITNKFSIPISLSVIASPATDDAHFVAALNF